MITFTGNNLKDGIMKRCKIILLFAITISMVACSWSDGGVVKPKFEEYVLSTDDVGACEVIIRYQQIKNAKDSEALASIDMQNYQNTFDTYALDVMDVEASAKELADVYSGKGYGYDDEELEGYYYHLDQRAFMTRDDRVVCYETYLEKYSGGVHGGCSLLYECFDLVSGALYDFSYLFEDAWSDAVRELVYNKLKEEYGVLLIESAEELPVTRSVLITDTGLLFVYNPYAVACFAAGILSVEFSDEEIAATGAPLLWVE